MEPNSGSVLFQLQLISHVLLALSRRHLNAVSPFTGQYSAVPPPQATQTKKGLAKAPAKKAESSDSSDSSDEAEQVPPKGGAGML